MLNKIYTEMFLEEILKMNKRFEYIFYCYLIQNTLKNAMGFFLYEFKNLIPTLENEKNNQSKINSLNQNNNRFIKQIPFLNIKNESLFEDSEGFFKKYLIPNENNKDIISKSEDKFNKFLISLNDLKIQKFIESFCSFLNKYFFVNKEYVLITNSTTNNHQLTLKLSDIFIQLNYLRNYLVHFDEPNNLVHKKINVIDEEKIKLIFNIFLPNFYINKLILPDFKHQDYSLIKKPEIKLVPLSRQKLENGKASGRNKSVLSNFYFFEIETISNWIVKRNNQNTTNFSKKINNVVSFINYDLFLDYENFKNRNEFDFHLIRLNFNLKKIFLKYLVEPIYLDLNIFDSKFSKKLSNENKNFIEKFNSFRNFLLHEKELIFLKNETDFMKDENILNIFLFIKWIHEKLFLKIKDSQIVNSFKENKFFKGAANTFVKEIKSLIKSLYLYEIIFNNNERLKIISPSLKNEIVKERIIKKSKKSKDFLKILTIFEQKSKSPNFIIGSKINQNFVSYRELSPTLINKNLRKVFDLFIKDLIELEAKKY